LVKFLHKKNFFHLQCGGPNGLISAYYDFSAPVTIGLNVMLYNSAWVNVAIDYATSGLTEPPIPGSPYPTLSNGEFFIVITGIV